MIANSTSAMRTAMPGATLWGCLGNHDAAPDGAYGSSDSMQYLYKPLADNSSTYVEATLGAEARASLAHGGWFVSFTALPGVAVVSLNTNYWYDFGVAVSPPQPALAAEQLAFLNQTVMQANAQHLGLLVLGHENPSGRAWQGGYYVQYLRIVSQTEKLVAQLWGISIRTGGALRENVLQHHTTTAHLLAQGPAPGARLA